MSTPIEQMSTSQVVAAARAGDDAARAAVRARIRLAEGDDAAATWAVAIWGRADDGLAEAIAWDAPRNAQRARVIWRQRLAELRAAVEEDGA